MCSQLRIRNFSGSKSWRGNGGLLAGAVFRVFGFSLVPCLVTSGACLRFTLREGRATIVLQQLESITQDSEFLGELLDLMSVDVLQRGVKTKGSFDCKTSDQIRSELKVRQKRTRSFLI